MKESNRAMESDKSSKGTAGSRYSSLLFLLCCINLMHRDDKHRLEPSTTKTVSVHS